MSDVTLRRPISWSSYALTHVGNVRKNNEDAVLSQPQLKLWAVADGMGGHAVGDLASQRLVEALANLGHIESLGHFSDLVEDRIHLVNEQLLDYSARALSGAMIGSTIVTLLVRGESAVCLWAGDSRLYRVRGAQVQQVSSDHSQVQEWVDQGLISAEEAQHHPQANVITRAVGVQPVLQVDFEAFRVYGGETLLLCSDGLSGVVSEQEISALLAQGDAQQCCQALLDRALKNGSKDNVSVIVIKAESGGIAQH
ncbi:PP2C family protein-serine/threonine phosphatase [Agaribacterium haliotis]|uniref:PP2C family protein-serine/threonine phosphatase n=1 Tax=Agaribacterium haliotis TaxID=2013869 RepID=UPI000BB54929|nr:protein phosphatase 2C domain-containing protein [Agaribacterium haliotis]